VLNLVGENAVIPKHSGFGFQITHPVVACTSFVGVIVGASVATSSETAAKILGAINAGCFIYLGLSKKLELLLHS
jgi:hypothetical protein